MSRQRSSSYLQLAAGLAGPEGLGREPGATYEMRTQQNKPRRIWLGICTATALVVLASPTMADQVTKLAQELAQLRSEVETLSHDLSSKQSDLQNDLKSYARQKAELEAELQREKIRLQKIQAAVVERKGLIDAQTEQDQKLRPSVELATTQIRTYVEASLPFRKAERLAELEKIGEQYKSGLLTPDRALARLWAFMEDEFRLTSESGVFRQTVSVDGKDRLADVVRLGMVSLYYKTGQGEYGFVAQENGNWSYKSLEGAKNAALIENLFESFSKQIRVGYFEVPLALAQGVNQ